VGKKHNFGLSCSIYGTVYLEGGIWLV